MMSSAGPESLDELLDHLQDSLTRDAAQRLIELRASPAAQARLELLSAKYRRGQITPEELGEYEAMVRAGAMISLIQAKAKRKIAP